MNSIVSKCMNKITDLFYPKICYLCNAPLQENGLCHKCWNKIRFIQDPACKTCGNPFSYDMGESISCGKCIQNKKYYIDYAKSIMKYDINTKKLIMSYKNHNCFYLTNFFANLMNNSIKEWADNVDYIIPIPLHNWRLFWRGYNQTEILTKQLSKIAKISHLRDGLLRTKWTYSQSKFNKAGRKKNMENAFEINYAHENKIKGKNVLILDDVTTTGATLNSAAKVLKDAGVKGVYCITIAKSISF
ncbi:ComF family protein [Candidatus Cytomitobacter indipagum]|uniref:ComF family protein n=1 Tax=Candidatus Cytomitobacter indipagum TaxID=2601575 RepID=A0A5C0UEK7_9PROT|nr:ComF family protein [Candidatus Cytomitobacter indipagum]QEK38147.1 ComF family protein [Candidatus Cytomitobacter indipagum]